jgi:UDP-N-acetylmuramoylalanine-D-glutamate ligase
MKKFNGFALVKDNGTPDTHSIKKPVWLKVKLIIGGLVAFAGVLSALSYLSGVNRAMVLAGEDIKLIQPTVKTVKAQEYEITSMKKTIEDNEKDSDKKFESIDKKLDNITTILMTRK